MNSKKGKLAFYAVTLFFIVMFFVLFADSCSPFLCGFALAYVFTPIIDAVSEKINRTLLSFVFVAIFLCIFFVAVITISPILRDYTTFIVNNWPAYYENFTKFVSQIPASQATQEIVYNMQAELQKYLKQEVHIFISIAESIVSQKNNIANFCSFIVIMPIAFFYCLKDWNKLVNLVHNIIPVADKHIFIEICNVIRITLRKFFKGQFSIVLCLSFYYTPLLYFIMIDNFLFFGMLSALFSFIPFIGALFSCFLVIFVNAPSMTVAKLYITLAIYLVGQCMEGYLLTPKLLSKKIGLHPLWILFAFSAGIKLLGVIGVLIAIPIAALAKSLIHFFISRFKASQAYKQ